MSLSPQDLFTKRDPHSEERRAIVTKYPALMSSVCMPIESLRETVRQNGDKLHSWPSARTAPVAVAEAPRPKPTAPPAVAPLDERAKLAAAPGLSLDEQLAIRNPKLTDIDLARYMSANPVSRNPPPPLPPKPTAVEAYLDRAQAKAELDLAFGLATGADLAAAGAPTNTQVFGARKALQPLPPARVALTAEAREQRARLDQAFGLGAVSNAQTFGASAR